MAKRRDGFRSGLERANADHMQRHGIPIVYEQYTLPYEKPTTYTFDFLLPNGIIIETKGRFESQDRTKHKYVKAQHPDLDLRFVFSNSRAKLYKKSNTTYGTWCDKHDFKYADKLIPLEWFNEPANLKSLAALAEYHKSKK